MLFSPRVAYEMLRKSNSPRPTLNLLTAAFCIVAFPIITSFAGPSSCCMESAGLRSQCFKYINVSPSRLVHSKSFGTCYSCRPQHVVNCNTFRPSRPPHALPLFLELHTFHQVAQGPATQYCKIWRFWFRLWYGCWSVGNKHPPAPSSRWFEP